MEQEDVLETKDEDIHEEFDYLDLEDQQGEEFTKEHSKKAPKQGSITSTLF